jgi:hypothetical protein
MSTELNRVKHPDGGFVVIRVREGNIETLREITTDTGEVPSANNELATIQTIVITRRIGEKIIL